MADLLAFSSESFNVEDWINTAIKDKPLDEALESFLAAISMKLHILSQDYTDQLENAMLEGVSAMPRIVSDISKIEDNLENINEEMKRISSQLLALDKKNVAGIEDLSRLDTIKSNMENCTSTLSEHARWNQLVREAKSFLEGGGRLADSAERIEIMRLSLEVLKDIPGHEDRLKVYEEISLSLQEVLLPMVKGEISGHDIGSLQEYLFIFKKLDRESDFLEEYIRSRPSRLLRSFPQCEDIRSYTKLLQDFYDDIGEFLASEIRVATTLFGDMLCVDIVARMLIAVFEFHHSERISTFLKYLSPSLADTSSTLTEDFYQLFAVSNKFFTIVYHAYFQSLSDGNIKYQLLQSMMLPFMEVSDNYIQMEMLVFRRSINLLLKEVDWKLCGDESLQSGDTHLDDSFTLSSVELDHDGLVTGPLDVLQRYSDRLQRVVRCIYPLWQESMNRGCHFLGGLKMKLHFRNLFVELNRWLEEIRVKIEEYRLACGFSHSSEEISIKESMDEGKRGFSDKGSSKTKESIPKPSSSSCDNESWNKARQLGQELESRGEKTLVALFPSVWAIMQTVRSLHEIGPEQEQWTFHTFKLFYRHYFQGGTAPSESTSWFFTSISKLTTSASSSLHSISSNQLFERLSSNLTMDDVVEEAAFTWLTLVLRHDGSLSTEIRSFLTSTISQSSSLISIKSSSSLLTSSGSSASSGSATTSTSTATSSTVMTSYSSAFAPNSPMMSRCRQSSVSLVLDLCTYLPEKYLFDCHRDPIWMQQRNALQDASTYDPLDYDNVLPQSSFTQVGEHLLSIVQEMESWANHQSPNELPGYCLGMANFGSWSKGWKNLRRQLEVREDEAFAVLCQRDSCKEIIAKVESPLYGTPQSVCLMTESQDNPDDYSLEDPTIFVNEWLGIFSDAILGLIFGEILAISRFSSMGIAQLRVDLEYMSNIIQAMGIRVHPLLGHLFHLLMEKDYASVSASLSNIPALSPAMAVLLKVDQLFLRAMEASQSNLS